MRKQGGTRKKQGGARRVRIREVEPMKIFNLSRKNISLPAKKPYNKYRGREGIIYGFHKPSERYIVDLGENLGVPVNSENIEFLNSEKVAEVPCERCKKVPSRHSEQNIFSQLEHSTNGINMSDHLYVEQDTFKITMTKDGPLYTYGLATCTALGFKLGSRQFLTHISADTDIRPIIESVKAAIGKSKITDVKIWSGLGDHRNAEILLNDPSNTSSAMALEITRALGVKDANIKWENVCFAEIVGPA